MTSATYMDYGLWLLCDDTGAITLTGWSQTPGRDSDATAPAKAEHWPIYTLCQDRSQLPARLTELGLELAPGADINDLDKDWDVYLQHPDITALRARLESERARHSS
ncbi:hypothetical protein [Mycobacterium xenopi]|uniref:hypothetical protein n=1 Tax=Mycobacterium xenopi TaxID=1789 RepID=UPI000A154AD6|nr:hypothetical protein [Mycobacterium xenopi]ORX14126.1 hypothetical protein AWC32_14175 [Mycobacterium xenopi]SPX94871.1 Uncharacterised protein [Mycobacterium xenopi]